MKIIGVKALQDYKLQVTFDDEITGVIDLKDFVETGIFSVLKDKEKFKAVYTNDYAVAWNDDLEIDALTIYAEILNKEPQEILETNYQYATN